MASRQLNTGWRTKYSCAGSGGSGSGAEEQPPQLLSQAGCQHSRPLAPAQRQLLAPELLQVAPPAVATHCASLFGVDTRFFLIIWWGNGGAICLQAADSKLAFCRGVCGGLHFHVQKKATCVQQTCVYCLEVAKNTNKGVDQIWKRQCWKMLSSWTITCLVDE